MGGSVALSKGKAMGKILVSLASSGVKALALQCGINLSNKGYWEAKTDTQDAYVSKFLKMLEDKGFKRVKAKGADEYTFDYVGKDESIRYSARYGKGYQALLGFVDQ